MYEYISALEPAPLRDARRRIDDEACLASRPRPVRRLHAELKTLTELQKCPVKIWIMQEVPNFSWNVPRALARAALFHHDPEKLNLPLNSYFEQVADQEHEFRQDAGSDISVLNPTQYLFKGAIVPLSENGFPIYRDVHHLTFHGAMLLRPMFLPMFAPEGKRVGVVCEAFLLCLSDDGSCQCQLPVVSQTERGVVASGKAKLSVGVTDIADNSEHARESFRNDGPILPG